MGGRSLILDGGPSAIPSFSVACFSATNASVLLRWLCHTELCRGTLLVWRQFLLPPGGEQTDVQQAPMQGREFENSAAWGHLAYSLLLLVTLLPYLGSPLRACEDRFHKRALLPLCLVQ